jgi:1-acyl-sn-glycerol-3-phosphate acyltransferase
MLVLRSLLFNIVFYVNTIFWVLVLVPALLLPRRLTMKIAIGWCHSSLWLMKVVAGTDCRIDGIENIPPGAIIVASKHQSFWETFALATVFQGPLYILKRELTWIPFFGWHLIKLGMIPVDRGARAKALKAVTRRARAVLAEDGRQLMIFPEGTRRPPGAEPAYKFGVAHLYTQLGLPCVPVALNSGLYWPRRKFLRRPGTIRVEILPPIMPGLPADVFLARLKSDIETASDRLLAEGRAELAALG